MTTPRPMTRREAPENVEGGAYLPGEADGAYPNGTRVIKVESEEGDGTAIGTSGEVIASHYVGHIYPQPTDRRVEYFYFVLFDDFPAPLGIVDWKIGKEGVL